MPKMKVAQVPKAGADFEIVEREIPQPGPGQVRIRVQACGVCHSDVLTKEGGWPGLVYPRVPGHEVAGVIDEAGSGVTQWKKGQRVGVGWHGGQDGTCLACRRGDFANCANLKITGLSYDGGYQEYMIAPVEAVARMPESLDAAEAAPLLCAGITTFNALRHSGALPSDLVAVQGIGGLGHLGIQFAQKFGYQVAAIGRGPENAALAKKLGASVYIDSAGANAAASRKPAIFVLQLDPELSRSRASAPKARARMISRTPAVSVATFSRRLSSVTRSRNRARMAILIHLACQSFLGGQATQVSGINRIDQAGRLPDQPIRRLAQRTDGLRRSELHDYVGHLVVSYRLE